MITHRCSHWSCVNAMALYLNDRCETCGEVKRLTVGASHDNGIVRDDVMSFCVSCLRENHSPDRVLDMIELGDMAADEEDFDNLARKRATKKR